MACKMKIETVRNRLLLLATIPFNWESAKKRRRENKRAKYSILNIIRYWYTNIIPFGWHMQKPSAFQNPFFGPLLSRCHQSYSYWRTLFSIWYRWVDVKYQISIGLRLEIFKIWFIYSFSVLSIGFGASSYVTEKNTYWGIDTPHYSSCKFHFRHFHTSLMNCRPMNYARMVSAIRNAAPSFLVDIFQAYLKFNARYMCEPLLFWFNAKNENSMDETKHFNIFVFQALLVQVKEKKIYGKNQLWWRILASSINSLKLPVSTLISVIRSHCFTSWHYIYGTQTIFDNLGI